MNKIYDRIFKIFSVILVIFGLGFFTTAKTAEATTITTTSVKTGNKYGFLHEKAFPNSWKGYWGGKGQAGPIINEGFGDILGNCGIGVFGYVKGTTNYPWQMPEEWKKECQDNRIYLHSFRRTWTKNNGMKWAILGSPYVEPSINDDIAMTCQTVKIKNKKYRVLFLAKPRDFKVRNQYFRTKKLTKKYGHRKFSDMSYSPKF